MWPFMRSVLTIRIILFIRSRGLSRLFWAFCTIPSHTIFCCRLCVTSEDQFIFMFKGGKLFRHNFLQNPSTSFVYIAIPIFLTQLWQDFSLKQKILSPLLFPYREKVVHKVHEILPKEVIPADFHKISSFYL